MKSIKSVPNGKREPTRPVATEEQRRRVKAMLAGADPWVDESMVIHYGDGMACCGKRHAE